ncbi:MAG: ATP-dependent helicase HrpB [Myxococcaceae bacterium]
MAIDKVGGVGASGPSPSLETGKEKFGKVLEKTGSEIDPKPVVDRAQPSAPVARAQPGCVTKAPGVSEARAVSRVEGAPDAKSAQAAQMLDRVTAAQQRIDHILDLAQAGKNFTPAELIAMQAHVYRASQELDLAGKVVEKATGGVKQVLQTQL